MRHSALIAAAALFALRLAAQQREPARPMTAPGAPAQGMTRMGPPGEDEHMGGMMRLHAFMPEALLEHREHLQLTAQQVTRLEQLRDAAKAAHETAETQSQQHMQQMTAALGAANPDTAQIRAHFNAHHDAMGQAHWAMMRSALQARAVLNDGQRQWMEGFVAAMGQHEAMMGEMGIKREHGAEAGHGHAPGEQHRPDR